MRLLSTSVRSSSTIATVYSKRKSACVPILGQKKYSPSPHRRFKESCADRKSRFLSKNQIDVKVLTCNEVLNCVSTFFVERRSIFVDLSLQVKELSYGDHSSAPPKLISNKENQNVFSLVNVFSESKNQKIEKKRSRD